MSTTVRQCVAKLRVGQYVYANSRRLFSDLIIFSTKLTATTHACSALDLIHEAIAPMRTEHRAGRHQGGRTCQQPGIRLLIALNEEIQRP